jgi:ABC-type transporter Mla MlaB component
MTVDHATAPPRATTREWMCDVADLSDPDAGTVEVLCRLQLAVKRCGSRLLLVHACGELRELLDLMGLSEVLPLCGELELQSGRQTEEREPATSIEKERDPADPIA